MSWSCWAATRHSVNLPNWTPIEKVGRDFGAPKPPTYPNDARVMSSRGPFCLNFLFIKNKPPAPHTNFALDAENGSRVRLTGTTNGPPFRFPRFARYLMAWPLKLDVNLIIWWCNHTNPHISRQPYFERWKCCNRAFRNHGRFITQKCFRGAGRRMESKVSNHILMWVHADGKLNYLALKYLFSKKILLLSKDFEYFFSSVTLKLLYKVYKHFQKYKCKVCTFANTAGNVVLKYSSNPSW